jgi:hypothetical protein
MKINRRKTISLRFHKNLCSFQSEIESNMETWILFRGGGVKNKRVRCRRRRRRK